MKRKGFTLVELLVVIAIIALLMGILMPALTRVRQIAYRMMCASNLSGIGKAMLLYAADNQEEFPRSGGSKCTWSKDGMLSGDDSPFDNTEALAYAESDSATEAPVTIGSSLYLLVKYAEVTPKQFVCKGDAGTEIFTLDKWPSGVSNGLAQSGVACTSVTDAWDFGSNPGKYCSYAYQMPFNVPGFATDTTKLAKPVRTTSKAGTPVAADRNPYFDKNNETRLQDVTTLTAPTCVLNKDVKDPSGKLNSACHQWEGQNVLYVDGSTRFEKLSCVGIDNDNIYLAWASTFTLPPAVCDREIGGSPWALTNLPSYSVMHTATGISRAPEDAFLVNELQSPGGTSATLHGGGKPAQ